MLKYVLGIDAAWTETEPSGIALVTVNDNRDIKIVKLARSYEEFYAHKIKWDKNVNGSKPELSKIINYCRNNDWNVNHIALDIPLSPDTIIERREADKQISKKYGGRGASTHSPNSDRPGEVSVNMFKQLMEEGFIWNGDVHNERTFIEVYPHTAIIELFKYEYRFPYKVQKINKYWPTDNSETRKQKIKANLNELRNKLSLYTSNLPEFIPELSLEKNYTTKFLKGYEDVLDALVCAITGVFYLNGKVKRYGDELSAIWVPDND